MNAAQLWVVILLREMLLNMLGIRCVYLWAIH